RQTDQWIFQHLRLEDRHNLQKMFRTIDNQLFEEIIKKKKKKILKKKKKKKTKKGEVVKRFKRCGVVI
ncbi:hypothetical protein ACJEIN_23960, partial [Escherichia coli]